MLRSQHSSAGRLCHRRRRAEIVGRRRTLSEDTGRRCGSWSVTDRRRRGLMWLDLTCWGWPQRPWSVWKRLSKDHERRGRSSPGCRIVGSVTSTFLTIEADVQLSVHCLDISTGVISDQIGHQNPSRGEGCSITSACTLYKSVGMSWGFADHVLSMAALRRCYIGHNHCLGTLPICRLRNSQLLIICRFFLSISTALVSTVTYGYPTFLPGRPILQCSAVS